MPQKKYPAYKPSGVEWIGDIPKHWEVNRLKYIAEVSPSNIDKKSAENEEKVLLCNYVDVYKNEFISPKLSFMEATATKVQIKNFELKKGDVLATKDSEDPRDIAVPAVVKKDLPGVVCGYHLTHIRPNIKRLNGFYLHRLFQSYTFNQQFTVKANGVTRYGLPAAAFTEAFITCPPLKEQQAIASYLNQKTALIDDTVRKKKLMIELLQEERSAIINRAVTKGMDPNVKMKDSGLEWLGMVPELWTFKKIKHVVKKVGSGVTPKGGAEVYQEFGVPLLRSQNVYMDGLRLEDVAYISESVHESMSNSRVQTGDVLLNITGASIGRCYFVQDWLGEANVNQHVCILRPNEKVTTKFLYFILASELGQLQINQLQTGANREGLNYEQLRNFVFPLPSVEEQIHITEALERKLHQSESIIDKMNNEIKFLQEYRTALINEVVTGKRCVIDNHETISAA